MSVVLSVVSVFVLASVSYYGWRREKFLKKLYWPALVLRLAGGIAVGLVYKYYYSVGDTFNYFRDGAMLAKLARDDFQTYLNFMWSSEGIPALAEKVPRVLFMSKLTSVFNIVTGDNYWITTLYFSIFSFAGCWFFVRQIANAIPEASYAAALAFLFVPSVIFWTSGLIKESISAGSLCYLAGIFLRLWFNRRVGIVHWFFAALSAWVLWSLKYYFVAGFLPVTATTLFNKFLFARVFKSGRRGLTELLVWVAIFLVPAILILFIHPNFYPTRLLHVIVDNYQVFVAVSDPEDVMTFYGLEPTLTAVLVNAPLALVFGLSRPFLWEAGNFFQAVIGIENLIIVVASVFAVRGIGRIRTSPHRMLIVACLVYVGLLCIFITLATPNFGTLARYRVGYWPFFIFLVLSSPVITRFMQRSFGCLVR